MSAVSILVPTYNRAGYLKECVDSLLLTTVPCEIIVADNASTDDTAAMMATYSDPRIRYVRHAENGGGFFNYNFLLAAATKPYICLFGDDDIALPGCFEKKLAILDNNPDVDGAYGTLRIMDAEGNLSLGTKVNGVPGSSFVRGRDEFDHLLINCCISWQTLVFRRTLYELYGGIKDEGKHTYAIDWDYLIEISRGRHFAYIDEPTVGVRVHAGSGGNKSARESGSLIKDMIHIWRKWLLETDLLPALPSTAWGAMKSMVDYGVQSCYGSDEVRMKAFQRQLQGLQREYVERMDTAFYTGLATWLPDLPDLDEAGLPTFRPGITPLALDTYKALQFFHHPAWDDDNWEQVLRAYLAAFTASDDVEMVLWHDGAQDVTVESASQRIEAVVASMGADPEKAADIQLLTDPLDLAGLAALYAAMHVVVPGEDSRQLERGTQAGVAVMTRLEPEVWRRLAARLLGRSRV
jgi:glycosyltransferase involved in cell wall biosynthesis